MNVPDFISDWPIEKVSMPRVTPSAPALRSDLGAISKLEDSPPPEYSEVVQQEIIKNKTDTLRQDVESVRHVKKRGCCSRTLNVFKIILVIMLLATFALAVLIVYRLSFFDQDKFVMGRQVDNLQRRLEDLYSTIYVMEKRLDSNHPTSTSRTTFRPAQSHGFRNVWGGF